MKELACWKCGQPVEVPPLGSLPFRATCDNCLSWQHCCKNCSNYKPGLPNDCKIPGTDPIADRENSNFCDEFVVRGEKIKGHADIEDVGKKLFGDDGDEGSSNKSFDDLFKS